VRTSTRIGLVGALSAMFVVGASGIGVAAPKAVSTKRYAKTVCGAYLGIPDSFDEFTTAYNTAPTDPPTFQSTVVTSSSDLVASLKKLQSKVKAAYPDIDNGKKVTKLFVNDFQRYIDKVSSAAATLKAADPNGVAFAGDQAKFEAAITVLASSNPSDPFSKVRDQDLLQAFKHEKSCSEVVTIYGG
jgi:hypothetical protein